MPSPASSPSYTPEAHGTSLQLMLTDVGETIPTTGIFSTPIFLTYSLNLLETKAPPQIGHISNSALVMFARIPYERL